METGNQTTTGVSIRTSWGMETGNQTTTGLGIRTSWGMETGNQTTTDLGICTSWGMETGNQTTTGLGIHTSWGMETGNQTTTGLGILYALAGYTVSQPSLPLPDDDPGQVAALFDWPFDLHCIATFCLKGSYEGGFGRVLTAAAYAHRHMTACPLLPVLVSEPSDRPAGHCMQDEVEGGAGNRPLLSIMM